MGREVLSRTIAIMNTLRPTRLFFSLLVPVALGACTIPSDTAQPPTEPATSSSLSGTVKIDTSTGETIDAPASTGSSIIKERLLSSGMAEVGAANAPVSLMLFTDSSCGYCRDFHEDLLPRLMNDYVRSGKVRISVVPFVVRKYENSESSALAQLCAARQSKGMAMQDLLFRESPGTAAYRAALDTLQLDQERFAQCMDDPATRTTMEAHQSIARSLGITLIPSYTINGKLHTGLPDYPDMRGMIEEELRTVNDE